MVHTISISLLTWQKSILLLILLTSCSGQITYYVRPAPDVPCPGQPCHTLSEYVADNYFPNFTVNTTMEFLPGNHSLEQTISVTNLTWLILHGDSSSLPEVTSRIVCTWPAGFIFTNIIDLHIRALGFLSCGHSASAAVSMFSVQQSDISDCIFLNSTNNNEEGDLDLEGGALYINTSSLTLTGNTFENNSVTTNVNSGECLCAGALYVGLSIITLTDNIFQSNSASIGGAVIIWNGTFTLTGNCFRTNLATYYGGALFIEYGTGNLKNNTFQNNNTSQYGGAVCVFSSTLNLTSNMFQLNFAQHLGGALVIEANTNLSLTSNNFSNNAAALQGGAISTHNSSLNLKGNKFQSNSAHQGGALLIEFNNTLSFIGNEFWNNSANEGGALSAHHSILNLVGNLFQNNTASAGGALSIDTCNHLSITGNNFLNNSAHFGGALVVGSSTLNLISNIFQGNSATKEAGRGGALYMYASSLASTNDQFIKNSAQLGGAILAVGNSTTKMYEKGIFRSNKAQYGGGIAVLGSPLELLGNTIFCKNTAAYGGGLYAYNTEISGKVTVTSNSATEGGGGVYAAGSVFHFKGTITVVNNSAMVGNGGGLLLSDESKFYLQPDTHVHFISNSAKITGGAIKIEEHNPLTYCISSSDVSKSDCFFQIENQTVHWMDKTASEIIGELSVGIYFDNNSAVEAGADLHGGSIDHCRVSNANNLVSGEIFDKIASSARGNTLDISSDPLHICTCKTDCSCCSGLYLPKPVYPGGTLKVPVIARGQRNGTTAAVIQVVNTASIFQGTESIQNTSKTGSTLNYTILSNSAQNITLYAEGPCPPTPMNTLNVVISILPCPPGFELSHFQQICICAERLVNQHFTNTCLIDDQTVLRARGSEFWVGYHYANIHQGLILNPHCPFDYCKSKEMHFSVEDSDIQCNYNRSGLLCGNCSDNLSLVLGSSRCKQCFNLAHLALLPAFAFAGIALVFLLLALRLTVAAGTINGLIFYANVVAVNSAVLFPPKATNVLTVFIAWLNLDLGIETCFYNGMDAYVKTWLQFVFPLYVWALVGIIILGSHISGRLARIFGKNPVAVLATLFLLSYTKLLRTAFAALSSTILEYPDHKHQIVWLYDGNIRYLSRKHIPLFIAAMVCLIVLFLPYTMLLMFSQWLQAKSMYKIFSWVDSLKIKPFLDAYHAPYTNKHRYWTGLMLLVRFILFLISAFPLNTPRDSSVNLLAIASATTVLLTLLAILGNRVYKNWCLSLLEISFLLNLAILAAATLYVHPAVATSGGNQNNTATFISVGIAFVTFIVIVIYHSAQQIKGTWLYKRVSRCLRCDYIPVPANDPEDPPDVPGLAPTHTVVDIYDREACTTTN